MSKHKDLEFEDAIQYITNKKMAINTFVDYNLDRLQQVFIYEGLPETIPQNELEKLLLRRGHCFITKVDNELYALSGGFSGEVDVYNNPRFYTVTNVALNLSKTYQIGVDGILFKNDFNIIGLLPLLKKYGAAMVESEISLNTANILSRILMLISAPDDKTKASAELFLSNIINGNFSIIGETPFFDGVKLQTPSNSNNRYITQYIELIQYYKASFFNEIGLNSNYNMKRERLTENEIALNVDALLPFIDNMYHERQQAVDAINDMFGTEIVVDFNSIWKTNHEQMEQSTELADTQLTIVGETEDGTEVIVRDDNVTSESTTNDSGDSDISDSDISNTDDSAKVDSPGLIKEDEEEDENESRRKKDE